MKPLEAWADAWRACAAAQGGSEETQLQRLQDHAGLTWRADSTLVRASGADVRAYLHRMLTQDVQGMAPDTARRACLLDVRGRTQGLFSVLLREDELWLDAESGSWSAAGPILERYVIADDVALDPIVDHVRLSLAGPEAAQTLAAWGVEVPAGEALSAGQWWRRAAGKGEVFEAALPADAAMALLERSAGFPRLALVSPSVWEAYRAHVGDVAYPAELNGERLFNEAELEAAVSWTKGCFPGQEPVVMARHRGRPPNRLVHLVLTGCGSVGAGAPLTREGKQVGVLSSVAPAAAGGGRALGFVQIREPEDVLTWTCGTGTATIVQP